MGYPTEQMGNTPRAASPAVLFAEVAALTYSRAPASFDLSDMQAAPGQGGHCDGFVSGPIPYDIRTHPDFDNADPLGGFLAQGDDRPDRTEAERIGADRYGMTWPMIRAQRLHSGDTHVTDAIMRSALAHSRIGDIFTPIEIPQDPDTLYRESYPGHDPSGRYHPASGGLHAFGRR